MSEQDTRERINAIRARFGAGPTTMTDEQIEAGQEVYGAKLDCDMVVVDELQDTREKLEADVHSAIFQWGWDSEWSRNAQRINECVVRSWLNRQAEITKREYWHNCCQNHVDYDEEYKPAINELTAECDKLQEQLKRANKSLSTMGIIRLNTQIDKLTEERDKLYKRIEQLGYANTLASKSESRKIEYIDQLVEYIDKLEVECDQLQKVVHIQAESFRKLEQELKEARDAIRGSHDDDKPGNEKVEG